MANPWKAVFRLRREIWIMSASALVNRMGTMALPFLVLYLTQSRGFSASNAGVILSFYGVAALFSAPIGGWLSDKVNPIHIMVSSLVAAGILMMIYPRFESWFGISTLTFLWAFTAEFFRPANMTALTQFARADERKAAFALYRLAINLGMSVGPAVGAILATYSFRALFLVDGITNLIAATVIFRMKSPRALHPKSVVETKNGAPEDRYQRWNLVFALLGTIALSMVFFQHEATLPLFMVKDLSISIGKIGFYVFTVNTLLIIFLEIPLNSFTNDVKPKVILPVGSLLFAAGFGSLYYVTGPIGIIFTVTLWTFGEMIIFPGLSALFGQIAPPHKTGWSMGLYVTCHSIAFILGPMIGTFLYEHRGPKVLWLSSFACSIVAGLFLRQLREQPTLAV